MEYICRCAYSLLAQPFELDDIGREDGASVPLDEIQLTPNHEEAVSVKYEEHALLLCDVEGKTSKGQHVLFPTEAWPDDKHMQAREQCSQLGAQRLWGPK
jgi:hypothetical protein